MKGPIIAALVLFLGPQGALAESRQDSWESMNQVVGSESAYTVRRGDSLTSVGARFGVTVRVLAEANGLNEGSRLQIGQLLKIDNRHIVPRVEGVTIVVNVPQTMLFWAEPDGTPRGYPIAAGKPSWKTPLGDFTAAIKETDPTWDVPPSIQEEMRREGKPVLTHVPPSPENPLGKYWIGLSIPSVGIHGTNAPSSIYSLATHGCIRLHSDDIEELFSRIEVGEPQAIRDCFRLSFSCNKRQAATGRPWRRRTQPAYGRPGRGHPPRRPQPVGPSDRCTFPQGGRRRLLPDGPVCSCRRRPGAILVIRVRSRVEIDPGRLQRIRRVLLAQ